VDKNNLEQEIAYIRRRLTDLDAERFELEAALAERENKLTAMHLPAKLSPFVDASVTNQSTVAAKVALFSSLFAGRQDVFPVRWENQKSGRSGYSPVCSNEWIKGISEKLQQVRKYHVNFDVADIPRAATLRKSFSVNISGTPAL